MREYDQDQAKVWIASQQQRYAALRAVEPLLYAWLMDQFNLALALTRLVPPPPALFRWLQRFPL